MSSGAVNVFIEYIHGEKQRQPSGFILSSDGYWANYHYCPKGVSCRSSVFSKSISLCEEQTGLECGLFARRYTILWKNGINPGKGKVSTFKSKWSDDQIRAKLTELGFLGETTSTEEKVSTTNKGNTVEQLQTLTKLYESGNLTKEEFEAAKKKILND